MWIFIQLLVALYWAIDLSLSPYVLKTLLDRVAKDSPKDAFTLLSGPATLYFLLICAHLSFNRLKSFAGMNINVPLKRYIGDRLMGRMMQHSEVFFQDHFAGSLGNKIKEVMSSVPALFKLLIGTFFRNGLALIIAIATMWRVNYQFAGLLCLWIVVFVAKHYGRIDASDDEVIVASRVAMGIDAQQDNTGNCTSAFNTVTHGSNFSI